MSLRFPGPAKRNSTPSTADGLAARTIACVTQSANPASRALIGRGPAHIPASSTGPLIGRLDRRQGGRNGVLPRWLTRPYEWCRATGYKAVQVAGRGGGLAVLVCQDSQELLDASKRERLSTISLGAARREPSISGDGCWPIGANTVEALGQDIERVADG